MRLIEDLAAVIAAYYARKLLRRARTTVQARRGQRRLEAYVRWHTHL